MSQITLHLRGFGPLNNLSLHQNDHKLENTDSENNISYVMWLDIWKIQPGFAEDYFSSQ